MAGPLGWITMSQSIAAEEKRLREVKFQGVGHKWSIQNRQYYEVGLGWNIISAKAIVSGTFFGGYSMQYKTPCNCQKSYTITCDFQKHLGLKVCCDCGRIYFVSVPDGSEGLFMSVDAFAEVHMDMGGL